MTQSPWTEEELARLRSWFVRERKGTKKKMESRHNLETRLVQQKRELDGLRNARRVDLLKTDQAIEQVVAAIPDMPGWRDTRRSELRGQVAREDVNGREMFERQVAFMEGEIAKLEAQLAALPNDEPEPAHAAK